MTSTIVYYFIYNVEQCSGAAEEGYLHELYGPLRLMR